MKVSMNGLSLNLAAAFNKFAADDLLDKLDDFEKDNLNEIRIILSVLNCLYSENPDDEIVNLLNKDNNINLKDLYD